jgi:hypothetical protein
MRIGWDTRYYNISVAKILKKNTLLLPLTISKILALCQSALN